MPTLNVDEYPKLGKEFFEFMTQPYFGSKTKKEIESWFVYHISQTSYLENDGTIIQKAARFNLTPTKYNNLLLSEALKEGPDFISNNKERLLKHLLSNGYSISEDKITFSLNDSILKLVFSNVCMQQKILQNTSFNRDLVKISINDVDTLFSALMDKSSKEALDNDLNTQYSAIFQQIGLNKISNLPLFNFFNGISKNVLKIDLKTGLKLISSLIKKNQNRNNKNITLQLNPQLQEVKSATQTKQSPKKEKGISNG